jgi:hypothetical protein
MDESSEGLAKLLLDRSKEPRPLLFGPGRHGIIWSAKSACTTVLLWYLWQCDLLQAALFFNRWPHHFRNMLYRSKTYQAWASEVDPKTWSWLRVIRDPSARAVSSYRHALKFGYADEQMSKILGRAVDHHDGFSFELFLDFLSRINIAMCDIHHRLQFHPIEERAIVTRVINVDREDLVATLREIDLGPEKPREPFEALSSAIAQTSDFHHARRLKVDRDHSATRFTRADAWGEWPSAESFLNGTTREKIEAIYAKDFVRYADYI